MIAHPNTFPSSILARLQEYLAARGFEAQDQDRMELLAIIEGHPTAAQAAAYKEQEEQKRQAYDARREALHVYKLHPADVTDFAYFSPKQSLAGAVLGHGSDLEEVKTMADHFARRLNAPMVVCDGNGEIRWIADEPVCTGGVNEGYMVAISVTPIKDANAVLTQDIAEEADMVDAGLMNLRTAYAMFNSVLARFRKDGQHTGAVLFVRKAFAFEVPVFHREIV